MLHLEKTNRQSMQMIEFGSLGNYKHVQHTMFSPYHTVIVQSVIILETLKTMLYLAITYANITSII